MLDIRKTVGIYTLGCKVNQYESEAIAEELTRLGFLVTSPTQVCDAYVINTCTVTAESDRKARQFIRRAITKNHSAIIVVTGCLAQTSADDILKIKGVDAIIGNGTKLHVAEIISELIKQDSKPKTTIIKQNSFDLSEFESTSINKFERTRAYVKIEDGCENHCSYCIIPSARGKIRSKAPCDVIKEVTELTRGGCKEVVLTGIETASYGKDLIGMDLASLLRSVDSIKNIGRVRLGSLDPSMINEKFADIAATLSSLAPHFHLSLQSGSSRILALMKRKYNRDQAMRAIDLLRSKIPYVQFTTDIIVGFPNETDEDFKETCNFVQQARFLNVHVFPYSKRKGTLASEMDGQIPEEIKKARLKTLEKIVSKVRAELLASEIVARPEREVLFETYKNGIAYGHTPEFIEVAVKAPESMNGCMASVRLVSTDGLLCIGELLDQL